ncbi:substrate-binding domain-containing protein [Streptomyces sp. SID8379]|uniref:LacI family DNA-binding transcriptional regulator n=1 Tax=unclassified Streptomyces TaxID=2593676 RepID=UPI0005BDFD73|nr:MULTISPECIES: LacI family DNA-binding transcriptional regulator [unclassified Streptomyces]MYW70384.1 substrate-binding domain-containing protein [Streptomyces sp. SID8379]
MKPRVGIADVAREAGVSMGTVSNVFNRPEVVAVRTRSRVLSAVERLGYVRSESARVLRGQLSRIIAVVVHDLANPFCMTLVQGAEEEARRAGLAVMVYTSPRDAVDEARCLGSLTEHEVRGVLITPTDNSDSFTAALERAGIPFVLMDCDPRHGHPQACSVAVDDVTGGRLAVQHLLDGGHRTVCFIGGPQHLAQVEQRRAGAREALAQVGQPASALRELVCPAMTVAEGREAGRRLLALPDRPTALFCTDDLLALGVLQELSEAGLRVPDDMALVSCGDIDYASAASVPLTSLMRPGRMLGSTAVQLLEAAPLLLEGEHDPRQVVLTPQLTVRRSSLRGLHASAIGY